MTLNKFCKWAIFYTCDLICQYMLCPNNTFNHLLPREMGLSREGFLLANFTSKGKGVLIEHLRL